MDGVAAHPTLKPSPIARPSRAASESRPPVLSIGSAEVATHELEELAIGRVVDPLDSYDLRGERVIVLVDVLNEVVFRRGRPEHEDLLHAFERLNDLTKEWLRLPGDTAFRSDTAVPPYVALRTVDRGCVDALGVDMKDLRFLMIDPNGGMKHRSLRCDLRA